MQKTEIWAVEHSRITGFFRSQPDVVRTGSGFVSGSCRITVTALEDRRLGSLRLPRTLVTFEGGETSLSTIYRRFLLEFLSAGG